MRGLCNHIRLVAYVTHNAATRLYIWARPVLVAAGAELLRRAHLSLGDLIARCVWLVPKSGAALMFLREQARLGEVVNEVWVEFEHGYIPPLTFVAGRVAMLAGKVVLLRLLSHLLESAVGFIYLFGVVQCRLTVRAL